MQELFRIVRDNSERASVEQRRQRPEEGSLGLLRRHVLPKVIEGVVAKLAAKYDGPYKVARFLSPNLVQLKVPGSRQRRTTGLNDLKVYHLDDDDDDEIVDQSKSSTLSSPNADTERAEF